MGRPVELKLFQPFEPGTKTFFELFYQHPKNDCVYSAIDLRENSKVRRIMKRSKERIVEDLVRESEELAEYLKESSCNTEAHFTQLAITKIGAKLEKALAIKAKN